MYSTNKTKLNFFYVCIFIKFLPISCLVHKCSSLDDEILQTHDGWKVEHSGRNPVQKHKILQKSDMISLKPEKIILMSMKPANHKLNIFFENNTESNQHRSIDLDIINHWTNFKILVENNTVNILQENKKVFHLVINITMKNLTEISFRSKNASWKIYNETFLSATRISTESTSLKIKPSDKTHFELYTFMAKHCILDVTLNVNGSNMTKSIISTNPANGHWEKIEFALDPNNINEIFFERKRDKNKSFGFWAMTLRLCPETESSMNDNATLEQKFGTKIEKDKAINFTFNPITFFLPIMLVLIVGTLMCYCNKILLCITERFNNKKLITVGRESNSSYTSLSIDIE